MIERCNSDSLQMKLDKLRFSINNAREELTKRQQISVADTQFMGAVLDDLKFRIDEVCTEAKQLSAANALCITNEPIRDRYDQSGCGWMNQDYLTIDACQQINSAVEFVYATLCSYQSMDDFPDVDDAMRKIYVGVKYLVPKSDD